MTTPQITRHWLCRQPGCGVNNVYADGLCRTHYLETDPPAPSESCERCGARPDGYTQICGGCSERLCPDCYKPWTALACSRCRLFAGAGG